MSDVRANRRLYLDWLRGVAVLIMILWHVADAWTAPAARASSAFNAVILLGGWAAPLFLFLAGVSVALAGESRLARGTRAAAAWSLQRRGWQVFALAHLFRLQSFVLNPAASWSSLLKPDILNILGLGIVGVAWCWGRLRESGETDSRSRYFLAIAAVIVFITPWSREWQWPTVFQSFAPRLEAYIRPVNGLGSFSLLPWIAFVFVGAFIGSLIASPRAAGTEGRLQARLGAAGIAIALAGAVGMHLPSLTTSSFWTTSLSFFLIRAGVMIVGVPLAWLWEQRPTAGRWSPMGVFGQTSLFVYWVHVELAYGFMSYPLHASLSLPWALAGVAMMTLCMLGCARLWQRRRQPFVPASLKPVV